MGNKFFSQLDKSCPSAQNSKRRTKSEYASAASKPRRSLKFSEDSMSSAVISTSAALGRPFVFDGEEAAEVCPQPTGVELAEARPPQRAFSTKTDARLAGVTPASRLAVRPAPEMVSSGIAALDGLTGGLPRGCLTEICGPASSGRTTILLSALAAATQRGEFCAVVDASDALDPQSMAASGVDLDRLLWVRCGEDSQHHHGELHRAEHRPGGNLKSPPSHPRGVIPKSRVFTSGTRACPEPVEGDLPCAYGQTEPLPEHALEQLLRVADLLLESGGFGLIALDLGDLAPQSARHIPLTTWFRFRRAVEHTSTVLLAIERQSIAGSCSSLLIKLGALKPESAAKRRQNAAHGVSRGLGAQEDEAPEGRKKTFVSEKSARFAEPTHAQLLTGLEITAEVARSRMDRKPAGSAEVTFASKTAWAG